MSVTRITEFRARAAQNDALRAFLAPIVPGIAASPGCESCRLLQGHDDPARFLVIEVWESAEAHQASARAIPPKQLTHVRELLDGAPRGEYFQTRA